ncbi:hypothetical protein [Streptomyces sp. HUAS TT20]|uniref:hypothetical protein n=1 Tax=Streptomyces sp. HUAS TT20 TaxID=3447509 RepID=UPI0021DA454E|nr:hypothetical protein [Streptomyces sp. HUAS 15-9]UXY32137.1 hypothetical protein N8I87_40125 [Streptomyces sp. HUAS 15-9]
MTATPRSPSGRVTDANAGRGEHRLSSGLYKADEEFRAAVGVEIRRHDVCREGVALV